MVEIGFQEATTRLLDGTLDAMFDNAINQSDSLRRAIDSGARLLPIEGVAVDHLRRELTLDRWGQTFRFVRLCPGATICDIGVLPPL